MPLKSGLSRAKSDSTALALLIAMVVAVAVTSGASLSAAGSGALQEALRAVGFGRNSEISAEQRKQSAEIAQIERMMNRMDNEIGGLTTRVTRTESNEKVARDRLITLGGDLAAVTTEMKELRVRSETGVGEAWRKPIDHLNAAVTSARSDIIALRSSLDAYDEGHRGDLGALTRRIDRLEQTIVGRDAAGSMSNAASRASRGAEPAAVSGDDKGLLGLRGSAAGEARTGQMMDMGSGEH
jgi:hypothetical protein